MTGGQWSRLESFLRVVETGSFTAAAELLEISQPTVSRRVAELERALGARLFVRHARGVALTDRGAELHEAARQLDAEMEQVLRRAQGLREKPSGSVRLSVNEPLGVFALAEWYGTLHAKYPDIRLDVVVENAVADLSRRDADVAIRMFQPSQPDLVARRIGEVSVGLFASRDYVRARGLPQRREDITRHTFIGLDRTPGWAASLHQMGLTRDAFHLRTDSLATQLMALRAGSGIAGMHLALARRFPELVRVLPEWQWPPLELWLVMHEDLRSSPAVRAVWAELASFLEAYVAEGLAASRI